MTWHGPSPVASAPGCADAELSRAPTVERLHPTRAPSAKGHTTPCSPGRAEIQAVTAGPPRAPHPPFARALVCFRCRTVLRDGLAPPSDGLCGPCLDALTIGDQKAAREALKALAVVLLWIVVPWWLL